MNALGEFNTEQQIIIKPIHPHIRIWQWYLVTQFSFSILISRMFSLPPVFEEARSNRTTRRPKSKLRVSKN